VGLAQRPGALVESTLVKLSEVPSASTVLLRRVADADGDEMARFDSHGFWPGTEITVIRRAPFGDPIHVRLRGIDLALRLEEAGCLWVEIAPEDEG